MIILSIILSFLFIGCNTGNSTTNHPITYNNVEINTEIRRDSTKRDTITYTSLNLLPKVQIGALKVKQLKMTHATDDYIMFTEDKNLVEIHFTKDEPRKGYVTINNLDIKRDSIWNEYIDYISTDSLKVYELKLKKQIFYVFTFRNKWGTGIGSNYKYILVYDNIIRKFFFFDSLNRDIKSFYEKNNKLHFRRLDYGDAFDIDKMVAEEDKYFAPYDFKTYCYDKQEWLTIDTTIFYCNGR
jgi:hypothetical protein